MSYRDAIDHGETNVGLGMVPGATEEERMEEEINRLRDRLERAEWLLRLWMCGSVDPVEGETELQKDTSSFLRGD